MRGERDFRCDEVVGGQKRDREHPGHDRQQGQQSRRGRRGRHDPARSCEVRTNGIATAMTAPPSVAAIVPLTPSPACSELAVSTTRIAAGTKIATPTNMKRCRPCAAPIMTGVTNEGA